MPIHDWTRVSAGLLHNFHEGWGIRLRDALNGGILPPGYYALADQRVNGPEPDVVAYHIPAPPARGGLAVADAPPRVRQTARFPSDAAVYARKANRLAIRDDGDRVVAIIEIVSPGNKDTRPAITAFTRKAVEFLNGGVHVAVVDLFPPSARDPDGIPQAICDELADERLEPRPAGKPLSAVSFDAGFPVTMYCEPLAVGDDLPALPLFLEPGYYVPMPLEETYRASWDVLPQPIRDRITRVVP